MCPSVMDRYINVSLSADVMFVNGVAFFVAISRHINHIAVIPIKKRNQRTMLGCIDQLITAYEMRGFTSKNIFMDNECECQRKDLRKPERKIELNYALLQMSTHRISSGVFVILRNCVGARSIR